MMTSTALRKQYSLLVRTVTLVFVMLMLVAPALHHHHSACSLETAPHHLHSLLQPGMDADSHESEDSCVLCLWLLQGCYTLVTPLPFYLVPLSAVALLLIFVRIAALCNAPTPRRAPRAPPVALLSPICG